MKPEKNFCPDRVLSYFRLEWLPLAFVTLSGLVYNIGLLATPWFEGRLAQCLADILGGSETAAKMAMLVLDYIIANEDRHFNNFGALRNAETLEWLGMAPIYDSGSSLGYDKMPGQMRSDKDVICKPFKNHHVEQLKLVTDFDWIDFDRLSDVDELISSVLSCEEAADYIDEGRIHAITESVQRRIGHLQELAMTQTPRQLDTTEDDVREEVAADYAPKMEL